MEQSEVVLRAIGILTQSAEWIRTANRDTDGDIGVEGGAVGGERGSGEGQIGSLLAEVFPSFTVSPESTPLEAAHAVTAAALPPMMQLIGAFTYVFAQLAEVHDSGRTDITSEDLLRELALRMSRPNDAV
ncbi:hypothetical protein OIE62_28820 [Streptomyces scopuliridis]|uniref:Uncharacterized protein n=2 Tax=Streptomyces scopuliridis TaxID=452529 RepID=A0A2T7TCF1_9ACTN|nr:hypothetical protein [Streptomyces scopuliridis]PVE12805.1 hypothetical protein Y717_27605 [Streptomyces scopuliridis RB72]WSB33418.1 hypothetical protein OG949_11430 [Streptomyces scopuliridis]WSB97687.1 hypothetical protein OG835_12115 [Streptomyces scopuliridis]WSC08610.1 hypothetical protein OIE62_28820 [Streptomyces scopuliridis]